MEWNVKNAVDRDVERQHLNKILKEIRSTIDSVSNGGVSESQVRRWIAESQGSITIPPSPVITVTLEGDVTGSGSGRTAITVPATLAQDYVTEAPMDGLPYWRVGRDWGQVPLSILALSLMESSGFPSYDVDNLEFNPRTMQGTAGNVVVTNGDGVLGNPTFDLALVPNSNTGALLAITRDGFGRVTGTKPATITGTAGNITVANGDAVSGLPTINLATVPDGGVAPTLFKITRDAFGRVTNTQAATAADVPIAKLGSATWDNVQEFINVMNSPGLVEGGSFSDAGSGNLAYTSMRVAIRPTDGDTATLYMADIAGGSIAIPNDSATRFVGVQYNAGVPNVVIKTADTWDYDTEFPLGEVANLGGALFPLFNPFKVGDPITNIIQRFDAQAYAIRSAAGGLELSTDGTTRNLAMTAGVVWTRLNDHSIAARNSPTLPLIRVTPTGGTPPLAFTPGVTAWPNTEYISGTTLTTMTNNHWAVLWVFVNIGTGAWGFAHGTAEYNQAAGASVEQLPAYLTANFLRQNILVGRLIFQKSATTAIIESAFTRVFSTQAVSNHNQLAGLQGGALNEYYHMTAAQHADIPNYLKIRNDRPVGFFQDPDIADAILTINANSLSNPTPAIEVWADNGSTQANISSTTYGVNGGGIFHGRMARGTKASPSGVLKGDIYCGFGGRPYATGVGFLPSSPVSLHWVASENQTSTGYGGYFRILTTKTGTTSRGESAVITDNGVVWAHDQQVVYDPTSYAQTSFLTGYTGMLVSSHNQQARHVVVSYGGLPSVNICGTAGTPSAPAALGSGANMGALAFTTYAGSWVAPTILISRTTEAHSSVAQGTELVFGTTANGSNSRVERWKIAASGDLLPVADNTYDIGSSALRPKQIWAANGTINTSDAREKTEVRSLVEVELEAAKIMGETIGAYQWLKMVELKGDAAREHIGLTVQQAIQIMEDQGLNPFNYGFICYDEWEAQEEVLGEEGEVVQEARPAGDRYSFRMDELLAFVARGITHRLKSIEDRLDKAGL